MKKNNFWKNKTVMVTGHTGFKGSWLTLLLKSFDANVVGYALNPISKPNFFDNLELSKFLKHDYRENILNLKKLKYVIKKTKPSVVFHLAAHSNAMLSFKEPNGFILNNYLGTINILESICKRIR